MEEDIIPVLTRAGCNSGLCHGKARGQNGFQLSLLGFDADFDYRSIVQDARGRRVFPGAPDYSLLLLKPTARIPHGGGKRFEFESTAYQTLRRWIVEGFPRSGPNTPRLQRISVIPDERLLAYGVEQQLAVTAHYTDGSRRDVTSMTTFQSSEGPIAAVSENGLVEAGPIPGQATIMARYLGRIATCRGR